MLLLRSLPWVLVGLAMLWRWGTEPSLPSGSLGVRLARVLV
jgi:hypothetical protein